MRIAFWVRAGNKYGSLERYIALFAEMCSRKGHKFLLINEIQNTSTAFCARLEKSGVVQTVVGESLRSPATVFPRVVKYLRKWKPDVVQLHFINSLAIPLLKSIGVPLIYQTYHSGIDHRISLRTRFLHSLDNLFATRVFAVSEGVRSDEIRAGAASQHIQTIYLGLPLCDFETGNFVLQEREPFGYHDPQLKKIITVGRFFPVKGMRYVVEAAVSVMSERQDIVWWLVGKEGPESQTCQSIIESAGMRHRIDVLGQRNDVLALLSKSDFQVVGSLSEGLPLMVLEAAACSIPTIGTQIGGMNEAIIDGETGILVEASSSQALAAATAWLMDHPGQRKQMGQTARRYIEQNFDAEKHIDHVMKLFNHDYRTRLQNGH
jgi:glycosyltransferase involved in cell wall biosynthesis